MTRSLRRLTLVSFVLALSGAAWALQLGDPAPPIVAQKWLKGGPVDLATAKDKHVVVLEFWATWCGPCVENIPHLTKLQKKHKDAGLLVVGLTSSDDDLAKVERFVRGRGERMDYVVAYEAKTARQTWDAYMKPFKLNGIPQAFVIDKQGKLVWQGHPMLALDAVIEKVLAGESDPQKLDAAAKAAAAEKMKQFEAQEEALEAYFKVVYEPGQLDASKKQHERLLKVVGDDARTLARLADRILTDEGVQTRDVEFALAAATKANELTDGKDDALLFVYARALFDADKIDAAIATQKRILEMVKEDEDLRKLAQEMLNKYEARKKQ